MASRRWMPRSSLILPHSSTPVPFSLTGNKPPKTRSPSILISFLTKLWSLRERKTPLENKASARTWSLVNIFIGPVLAALRNIGGSKSALQSFWSIAKFEVLSHKPVKNKSTSLSTAPLKKRLKELEKAGHISCYKTLSIKHSRAVLRNCWIAQKVRNTFVLCSHRAPYSICFITDYRLSIYYDNCAQRPQTYGAIYLMLTTAQWCFTFCKDRDHFWHFSHTILSYSILSLLDSESYVFSSTVSSAASSLSLIIFSFFLCWLHSTYCSFSYSTVTVLLPCWTQHLAFRCKVSCWSPPALPSFTSLLTWCRQWQGGRNLLGLYLYFWAVTNVWNTGQTLLYQVGPEGCVCNRKAIKAMSYHLTANMHPWDGSDSGQLVLF